LPPVSSLSRQLVLDEPNKYCRGEPQLSIPPADSVQESRAAIGPATVAGIALIRWGCSEAAWTIAGRRPFLTLSEIPIFHQLAYDSAILEVTYVNSFSMIPPVQPDTFSYSSLSWITSLKVISKTQ
jgi:hypothetical protein